MLKIISAPFGNYINRPGWTSTIGTFTLYPRPGRWRKVLATVRYYPGLRAWTNRLGLANPGIHSVTGDVSDKIISIHGFNDAEWSELLQIAGEMKPLAIELNLSCPNVDDIELPDFDQLPNTWIIAKLPAIRWQPVYDWATTAGIHSFHCCNTLPVPTGGLSGKPLKAVSLSVVEEVARLGARRIIGGGGITSEQDIRDYRAAGATDIAVGTGWLGKAWWI